MNKHNNIARPTRRLWVQTALVLALSGTQAHADEPGIRLITAIRYALEQDPVIKAQQQQVEANSGQKMSASGQFDPVPSAGISYQHSNAVLPPSNNIDSIQLVSANGGTIETLNYKVALDQPFRSGVVVTPSLNMTRFETHTDTPNIAHANLRIVLPLLRGLGEKAVAANEIAANLDYEAATHRLWHIMAESMTRSTKAYWDYQAAARSLEILKQAEQRSTVMLDVQQRLAAADEIAQSEVGQFAADLSRAKASRIESEQVLLEAQQALGIALGVPFEQMSNLPLPLDDFPALDRAQLVAKTQTAEWTAHALQWRNDLAAANLLINSAEALQVAAENKLLPQINMQIDLGYTGLASGSGGDTAFSSFWRGVEGANAMASLNYSWPIYNQTARGGAAAQAAIVQQNRINRDNLARTISSNVLVAANNANNSLLRLQEAKESTRLAQRAYDDERKLQSLDESASSTYLLYLEDILTSTQLIEIDAAKTYAKSLVELRFASATLFKPGEEVQLIGLDRLTSLPSQK